MEEWRDIPTAPGYQASSEGRIRSVERVVQYSDGRRRKYPSVIQSPGLSRGYWIVGIGKRRTRAVHLLVAEAFHGSRPLRSQACHNNGDKNDNRPENIRWDTVSKNALDKQKHGTDHKRNQENCVRGHRLEGSNLRAAPRKRGLRECRACASARSYVDRHPGADLDTEAARYYNTYF